MARTLFGILDSYNYHLEQNVSFSDNYCWVDGMKWLILENKYILVNPNNGAWVVFDYQEYRQIMRKEYALYGMIGSYLYNIGMCKINGIQRARETKSQFTEYLYFFEFVTTTGCNLACKYCFADSPNKFSGIKASNELAELFIDRIAEYRINAKANLPFLIEFTGGEPLLNFSVIRHTVEYAQRKYGDYLNAEFIMQSNLSLLNDDIIEYCKIHKINIGISCDGFESVHDHQRPFINKKGSFYKVKENILKLIDKYPQNMGAVITVVTQDSVKKMPEIFLYLYLLGFKEINLRPMAILGRANKNHKRKPFYKYYINGLFTILTDVITPIYLEKNEIIQEHFLSRTFLHLFQSYHSFMCERSPCGGAKNICITMPDGDVFPCNQSTEDKRLLLGNIRNDSFSYLLNSERAISLQKRTLENIDECNECVFRNWCGSPCPHEALVKYGNIMAKSAECDFFKERYTSALKGLVNDEFDLEVISRLVGSSSSLTWVELKKT